MGFSVRGRCVEELVTFKSMQCNTVDTVNHRTSIPTGCASLDDLLNGGLPTGTVTQIYGRPGTGKTNVALQAVIEIVTGGGNALFIDTEGFPVDRFEAVLRNRISTGQERYDDDDVSTANSDRPRVLHDGGVNTSPKNTERDRESLPPVTSTVSQPESRSLRRVADRVQVLGVSSFDEQHRAVKAVTNDTAPADIVVVDSLTAQYREAVKEDDGSFNDSVMRDLGRQLLALLGMARRHEIPVLVTNQVYAEFTDTDDENPGSDTTDDAPGSTGGGGEPVKPLGGTAAQHWCGVILQMESLDSQTVTGELFPCGATHRRATVRKHESVPDGDDAIVAITDSGVETGEIRAATSWSQ